RQPDAMTLRRRREAVARRSGSLPSACGPTTEAPPGSRITEPEILDLLTRLVEKSLVIYDEDEQGCGRYRLLETVRQYAGDRLQDIGEEATRRSRHLAHFVSLAEESKAHLTGAAQQEWLERLEAEHANLRAALIWSVDAPSVEAGLRLAGSI